MSHGQQPPQAARPSPPAYPPSSYRLDTDPDVQMHPVEPPTSLQKWAARATDSQFHAVAGAVGGFTSGIITCPLDVIKTKLQAQGGYLPVDRGRHAGHPRLYNGLVGTAKVIWREEGIRGMYRGLGPIVMGYLPTWAVWFTVYNKSKIWLSPYTNNIHIINFWSSIIAGACSTVVTNPIWVIKTRLMSQSNTQAGGHSFSLFPKTGTTPTARPTAQSPEHYRSTFDAAKKMYTYEGIASFYSGLTPALLGLTHVAVQFPTYEYLKKRFTGQVMGEQPANGGDAHWLGILSASVLSKILASTVTYPHEVIRTRLQTQRRPVAGVIRTFRTILHEEGWRAFYAGLGTNMTRAVPAATVTMLTYEYVMGQLNREKEEGRERLRSESSASWSS